MAAVLVALSAATGAAAAVVAPVADAGVGRAPDCTRPYTDASPWNRPIPPSATYDSNSAARVKAIGGSLSSDPTQFTYPVYYATAATPKRTVTLSGWLSRSNAAGSTFSNIEKATVQVRVPAGAAPASGSDAQVIIVDLSTGHEWGFFNFRAVRGGFVAQNGYRYNVGSNGAPTVNANGNGFVARGAGIPYLAGLVRPCEVERGSIEHALAFAYDAPGAEFVYPAGKSDGSGAGLSALPEGARLQLDPALTEAQIRVWGCVGACLTIARALQRFGMYVVDNSGRAKVMMEFAGTARWKGGLVSSKTASPIPLSAFKVLAFASGASPAAPSKKKVKPSVRGSKRLAVDRYRVRGRKLRAGRKFAARLTLRPSARYKRIPAGLRIACPARIGSQSVNVLRSRLMGASSRARVSAVCLWAVPAGTSGKRFRASVTVGYKGGETKIRFVGKIRKAR